MSTSEWDEQSDEPEAETEDEGEEDVGLLGGGGPATTIEGGEQESDDYFEDESQGNLER